MTTKTQIKDTDTDFADYEVRIHGTLIDPKTIISANTETGEVWCRRSDELKTGAVTITKILPPEPEEPELDLPTEEV